MREPLENCRVALLLACVGVAGWVTVGCFPPQTPGTSGTPTKLTLTYEKASRTAAVSLPEGSGVDPTKLTVMSSIGTATPGSDGSASVEVIAPGPQLAVVLSPGGKPMLMGWLDDYHPALDCRTTAEVLLYHRLCLWLIPPEVVHRAVGGLHQTNVLGPIVTALGQAIVADPEGLLSGDAAVTAAVEAAAQQVLASAQNTKGKASAAVINPEEARSGLTVTQTGGMNAVTIANALRRRGHAWLSRDSYVAAADGTRVVDGTAITDVAIPAGGIDPNGATLGNLALGTWTRVPATVGPLEFARYPEGALSTRYRLMTVGAGEGEGDMALLTTEERAKRTEIVRAQFVADILLPPFVGGLLPVVSPALDAYLAWVVDSTSVKGLVDAVGSAAPGVWQKLDAGDVEGAVTDGLAAVMGSGSLRQAFLQWIGDTAFGSVANASKLADQVTQYVGAFGGVDGAAANMDLLLAAAGWLEANGADKWDVDGGWVTVSLEPNSTTITYFQDVALKTELSTTVGSGVELFYVYKSYGPSGAFFSGATPQPYQDEFETDKDAVIYNAFQGVGHEGNKARVDVYLVDGGEKVYLGTGEATIKVEEPPVAISPPTVIINKDELAILTCKVSGIPGPFYYKWSGKRVSGEGIKFRELGTTDWLSKIESGTAGKIQVGRQSGYEGEGILYVRVLQGNIEIGTGECHITLNRYSVPGTEMGYGERDASGNGGVSYGVDFKKVEGAWQYFICTTGFNDPVFWGDWREKLFAVHAKLPDLRDRGTTYFYALTTIGGNLGSKSTDEYIAEMSWRFDGDEGWEVIPDLR